MSDIALSPRQPARLFSRPWIFGPRADLAVSVGGMLAGLALLFMFTALGLDVLLVWFVWVVTLDTPHFFASYFRTYLDKEERRTSRRLLIGTLSVFLVGPAVLLLCAALYRVGIAQFRLPWTLFYVMIGAWAYLHVTRQHYGILRLYNRKGGELGGTEARLDAIVLYGCLGFAFLGVLLSDPRRIGLGPRSPIPDTIWTSPVSAFFDLPLGRAGFLVSGLAVGVVAAWYVAFQLGKFMRQEPINLPKVVFLATVIFLHSFLAFSGVLPSEILGFIAIVTIYHDIQYFCVVWFHAKNRYGGSPDPRRQYGIAGTLSKSFPLFLAAGIFLISLPIWGFGCLINGVPVCATGPQLGSPTVLGDTAWVVVFVWLTTGFQMHHYILDQKIWKPSRSAQLRRDLNLEP